MTISSSAVVVIWRPSSRSWDGIGTLRNRPLGNRKLRTRELIRSASPAEPLMCVGFVDAPTRPAQRYLCKPRNLQVSAAKATAAFVRSARPEERGEMSSLDSSASGPAHHSGLSDAQAMQLETIARGERSVEGGSFARLRNGDGRWRSHGAGKPDHHITKHERAARKVRCNALAGVALGLTHGRTECRGENDADHFSIVGRTARFGCPPKELTEAS
jgi:hypothetical protein